MVKESIVTAEPVVKGDSEYAQSRVPSTARQGFWQILFVMVGFTFFSPSMMAGGQLGLGLSQKDFVLAIVLGNAFLAVFTGFLAHISQKSGLNLDLLSNHTFGSIGAFLPSGLISLTQLGWFGVGVAMFAIPVSKIWNVNTYFLIVVTGVLMTLTAVLGVKALAFFGSIAVPAIAILGSTSVYLSVDHAGGVANVFPSVPPVPMALSVAVGLVISNFVSGGTSTPNFARFGRTSKQAVTATVVAFFIGNIIMFVFGAVGAAVYGQGYEDIFEVLKLQGLIIPAILTLGFNIWSTNNNALYTAGLGFTNITKLPVKLTTAVAGIIGTLLASVLYNNFVSYLSFLGAMIPPVGAVIIIDYLFRGKEILSGPLDMRMKVNIGAVLSVVLGIVGALVLPKDLGITAINGLVIASVSYLISRMVGRKLVR